MIVDLMTSDDGFKRCCVFALNNMGPRTDDPCTPKLRGTAFDVHEPILMRCKRSDRYDANHALALPVHNSKVLIKDTYKVLSAFDRVKSC